MMRCGRSFGRIFLRRNRQSGDLALKSVVSSTASRTSFPLDAPGTTSPASMAPDPRCIAFTSISVTTGSATSFYHHATAWLRSRRSGPLMPCDRHHDDPGEKWGVSGYDGDRRVQGWRISLTRRTTWPADRPCDRPGEYLRRDGECSNVRCVSNSPAARTTDHSSAGDTRRCTQRYTGDPPRQSPPRDQDHDPRRSTKEEEISARSAVPIRPGAVHRTGGRSNAASRGRDRSENRFRATNDSNDHSEGLSSLHCTRTGDDHPAGCLEPAVTRPPTAPVTARPDDRGQDSCPARTWPARFTR